MDMHDRIAELEYRRLAYLQRKSVPDHAKSESVLFFYTILAGACDLAIEKCGGQSFPVEKGSVEDNERLLLPRAILEYLLNNRASFKGQSLQDAQSIIRSLLNLKSDTLFGTIVDETSYDSIDPAMLFRAADLYSQLPSLESALEDLPAKFRNAYSAWKEGVSAGSPKEAGFDAMLAEFNRRAHEEAGFTPTQQDTMAMLVKGSVEAPTSVRRRLYTLLQPFYAQADITDESRSSTRHKMDIQQNVQAFVEHIVAHVDEFVDVEKEMIEGSLSPFVNANIRDDLVARKHVSREGLERVPPYFLFKACHLYGLADSLAQSVEKRIVSQKFRAAYPGWVKKNAAFIAECAARNKAEDSGVSAGAASSVISNPTVGATINAEAFDNALAQVRKGFDNAPNNQTKLLYGMMASSMELSRESLEDSGDTDIRLVSYVVENANYFNNQAILDVQTYFSHLFVPRIKNTDAIEATVRRVLNNVPAETLFKAVHFYGFPERFTSDSPYTHVTPDIRARFIEWTQGNSAFAWECNRRHRVINGVSHFIRICENSKDPEEKKFYELCRIANCAAYPDMYKQIYDWNIFTQAEIDPIQSSQVNRMRYLRERWHYTTVPRDGSDDYRDLLEYTAATCLFASKDMTQYPFFAAPVTEVFEFVQLTNSGSYLKEALERNPRMGVTYDDYERWRADPAAFVLNQGVEGNDNLPPSPLDAVVVYHDVCHPVIVKRASEDGMGIKGIDEADQADGPTISEAIDEQRTRKLAEALKRNAVHSIPHIDVYRNVKRVDESNGHPYNLVCVHHADGSFTNIAVCDYSGNMTLVERNANKYVEETVLDREVMRRKQTTWPVVHFNDEQWIDGIKEILYADLTALNPALKNRSYWYSLGDMAVQTLVTKFMMAGKAPATVDTGSLIECGPLAGKSKYSLLYGAWNRGSIKGWMKGTTFTLVLDALTNGRVTNALRIENGRYIFPEGVEAQRDPPAMPWLKTFANKPPLTAAQIIAAAEKFERDWGGAVTDGFYDELKIDSADLRVSKGDPDLRRTGIEVNLALTFQAVAIPPETLAQWGRYPRDVGDLLTLAGIESTPVPAPIAA